jgi:hypothetical protein
MTFYAISSLSVAQIYGQLYLQSQTTSPSGASIRSGQRIGLTRALSAAFHYINTQNSVYKIWWKLSLIIP